jgi:hypothetical protein
MELNSEGDITDLNITDDIRGPNDEWVNVRDSGNYIDNVHESFVPE